MSAAVKRAIERMSSAAERQARAHRLDPADDRVRGLIGNVLTVAGGEFAWQEQELERLRLMRQRLQLAIGSSCANVEALVLQELAELEVFYRQRVAAEKG